MRSYFVIGYVGRSGSSYLQGLIHAHPHGQCLGEILQPGDVPEFDGKPLAQRIDAMVHSTGKRVSGFKFPHLHMFKHPEMKTIMREKGYRVLYLTRKNRLDQYISMKLAMDNNAWRSDFGDYERPSFIADPAHVLEFFDKFEDHDRRVRAYIEGLPTLGMSYEQLVEPDGYYPFLDFLSLERRTLVSPFHRQRKGSQRDAIVNYDEMAIHFAKTPWGPYFNE